MTRRAGTEREGKDMEKKDRLMSLDALRGFDMFFILLPDPVPCIVVTFLAMFGRKVIVR